MHTTHLRAQQPRGLLPEHTRPRVLITADGRHACGKGVITAQFHTRNTPSGPTGLARDSGLHHIALTPLHHAYTTSLRRGDEGHPSRPEACGTQPLTRPTGGHTQVDRARQTPPRGIAHCTPVHLPASQGTGLWPFHVTLKHDNSLHSNARPGRVT